MEIKTKFNIGDTCYYISKRTSEEIASIKVFKIIKISFASDRDNASKTYYYSKDNCQEQEGLFRNKSDAKQYMIDKINAM